MNRKMIGALVASLVLSTSLFAADVTKKSEMSAETAQCHKDFSAAKKTNSQLKTKKERAAANKDAKKQYNECVAKAKKS